MRRRLHGHFLGVWVSISSALVLDNARLVQFDLRDFDIAFRVTLGLKIRLKLSGELCFFEIHSIII